MRPGAQVGPFVLQAELGRGSFGVVYRAHDTELGRDVALKLLRPGTTDPETLARFRLEVHTLARLRHPHVVAVHGAGQVEGRTYVVLELVEGESLETRLRREGPLAPADALALARDLADALAHAHAQGVLHRDVKPANVLLTPAGRVCLADFGSARVLETTQLTETGVILGTPLFMAPEQITGQRERLGPATDVYSLGATLYTALTGRAPFAEGRTIPELIQLVERRAPAPPSAHRPGLPPAADAICARCLQKDPARRYPDAAALRSALDVALGREPGPASRRLAVQGGGRAGAGAALALLALAGAAGLIVARDRPPPVAPPVPSTTYGAEDPAHLASLVSLPAESVRVEVAPRGSPGVLRWTGELFLVELRDGARAQLAWSTPIERARLELLVDQPVEVTVARGQEALLPRGELVEPRWFERRRAFLAFDGRVWGEGGEMELPRAWVGLLLPQRFLLSGWRWRGGRGVAAEMEVRLFPLMDCYLQELELEEGGLTLHAPSSTLPVRWTGPQTALDQRVPITVEVHRLARYGQGLLAPPAGGTQMDLIVHARRGEASGWVPLRKLLLRWR